MLDPRFPLLLAQLITLVGLVTVVSLRASRDPKIGPPFLVILDSGGMKPVLFAIQSGLLIIALAADLFPTLHAFFALSTGMLLTWLSPSASDRACGEEGVFRGWYGRRYEELDEWRLTGNHLRFKLLGEWTAVEVPREKVGTLRSTLQRVAPDRESAYAE